MVTQHLWPPMFDPALAARYALHNDPASPTRPRSRLVSATFRGPSGRFASPPPPQKPGRLRDIADALRNTPHAFRLVWAADRRSAVGGIVLTIISAALPAAQAWTAKLIIDAVVIAGQVGMEPVAGLRFVAPYLGLEFGLLLTSSIVTQVRGLTDRMLQTQLTNHVNSMIITKAISLDIRFFEDPVFYDMLQNARRQADTSALNIVNSMLQMLQQTITLITCSLCSSRSAPWLAVLRGLAISAFWHIAVRGESVPRSHPPRS